MNPNTNLTDASVVKVRDSRRHRKMLSVDFTDCPNISTVVLSTMHVINCPSLAYFFGTHASNATFAVNVIQSLPDNLLRLTFWGNHLADEVLIAISRHCKELKCLKISGCRGFTADALTLVVTGCHKLQRIFINDAYQPPYSLWRLLNPTLKTQLTARVKKQLLFAA